jgi:hypothetical protein
MTERRTVGARAVLYTLKTSLSMEQHVKKRRQIIRHTERFNKNDQNQNDKKKKKGIQSRETTTRYRPAPPNRMHQNCKIPYTNAYQPSHIATI